MTYEETYEHLLDRHMLPGFYGVRWEPGIVSIPLRDFSGKWVGYQEYRPFADRNSKNVREARYFTYLPRGVNGYFGLESLDYTGPLYLVEGVFKATRLHSMRKAAISLMGSEVKRHLSQLYLLRRRMIAIGDNDAAGEKFARRLGGFVSSKDLDEMSESEVKELLYGN